MRIGLDNVHGYITNVEDLGIALEKVNLIDIEEFKGYVGDESAQIVDLRGVAEYNTGHVEGADNVFVGTILSNLDKIQKDKQIVIHCQGGDRAAIGYSVLVKSGFTNVKNYSPGMNEWVNTGNPVVSTTEEVVA
jgi:hydroxyacylglutathione hydrolase